MSTLDPRLTYLLEVSDHGKQFSDDARALGLEAAEQVVDEPKARVLVRFDGDLQALIQAGFEPSTVAGNIAAGTIALSDVESFEALDQVLEVEASRPMSAELDNAVADVRGNLAHTGPPGFRGSGTIVGIIDSGIDFNHPNFQNPDGSTRIIAIWDQFLSPVSGENNPSGFTYGVEYTETDVNNALAGTGTVRHRDGDPVAGHGTHVTGIAAGDGSQPGDGSEPAFTYVGMAPEADIIVVANRAGGDISFLGESANTLDAVNYIFAKAADLGRPVVINESQGENLGPHDGTSLLERGIDNLLGGPGRSMVKSAGNAGNDDIHAGGTLTTGGTASVAFAFRPNDNRQRELDLWYEHADRFNVSVTPPGAATSTVVTPGNINSIALANGNRVFIDSRLNDPNNGDNRIYLAFSRGTAGTLATGTWTINLTATATPDGGRWHGWIQRGGRMTPRFTGPERNNNFTVSVPGNSAEIITVASYVTRGAGVGDISSFSSIGPTRDGRQKPDIGAPGQTVVSARAQGIFFGSDPDQYHGISGTSMAAPMVAGTIACMLQKDPTLTQSEIKTCLQRSARKDTFTGTTSSNVWGAGKLDAKAAVDCIAAPKPIVDPKPLRDPKPVIRDPKPIIRDPKPVIRDPKPIIRDPKGPHDPKPIFDPKRIRDPKSRVEPKASTDPGLKGLFDIARRPGGIRPRRPFVLSTPSQAEFMEPAGELQQLEASLNQYEELLAAYESRASAEQLSDEEASEYQQAYQEYAEIYEMYRTLVGG